MYQTGVADRPGVDLSGRPVPPGAGPISKTTPPAAYHRSDKPPNCDNPARLDGTPPGLNPWRDRQAGMAQ
jgi:hypothetical protein